MRRGNSRTIPPESLTHRRLAERILHRRLDRRIARRIQFMRAGDKTHTIDAIHTCAQTEKREDENSAGSEAHWIRLPDASPRARAVLTSLHNLVDDIARQWNVNSKRDRVRSAIAAQIHAILNVLVQRLQGNC